MSKRYVLHPGFVRSKHDDQWHFIDAPTLASLHGVRLDECVIDRTGGNTDPNLEHLRVSHDGDYWKGRVS